MPVWELVDNNSGQDNYAWVSQGPVTPRWTEHLGESDKGIILYRRLLSEQMKIVEDGEDPMNTFRDPAKNVSVHIQTESDDPTFEASGGLDGASLLYGQRLTDEATCYKAFRTSLLRELDLEGERFEFCAEVTAKVCRLGIAVVEVPISYHPRSAGEGKKIGWRDLWPTLWTLIRWRFAPSSRPPLHA